MEKLSVVIITFNEERNIGRCIDSVKKFADEIIVLDSFSTDGTVEIAKEKGAVVYQSAFPGFIQQYNKVNEFASYNYVLNIDADEVIDPKLEASILEVKKNFIFKGYSMNRCTNYCGKFIKHGKWYPDIKLRLFDKRVAFWGGYNPHAKIEFESKQKIEHLKGNILHYSFNTREEYITQRNKFAALAAQSYFQKGKPFNPLKLFVNPAWNFINGYIIRMGFLDGKEGFLIARLSSYGTYLKYKKLRKLYQEAAK